MMPHKMTSENCCNSTVKNTFATNPSKLMLASSEAPTRIRREISPSKTNLLNLMATRLHLLLTTAEEKLLHRCGKWLQPEFWVHAVSPSLERSEEHTSELQSLMRISYAVFCLKKKK